MISVIIPNFNGEIFLTPCLSSVLEQGYGNEELEILLIDNGSSDNSVGWTRVNFPAVRVIECGTNLGFTRAINRGADEARGKLLLFLNNDTVMKAGALRALDRALREADERVIAVQPLLLWTGDENVVDSAGIMLKPRITAFDSLHGGKRADAPAERCERFGVCFACALLRRSDFMRCGKLDSDFFAEWDDVDFAFRARRLRYKFLLEPAAVVLHHRSPTSKRDPVAKFVRLRRNRLLSVWKSFPLRQAIGHTFYRLQHDLGMAAHFAKHGELRAVWRSWWQAYGLLPSTIWRRRAWHDLEHVADREFLLDLARFEQRG